MKNPIHDVTNPAKPTLLLDETIIQQIICDTDVETVNLLIDSFQQEAQLRARTIGQALSQHNVTTLEFEAHALSGTALALGCISLGKTAKQIEHLCLQHQTVDALDLASRIEPLTLQTIDALTRLNH